MSRLQDRLRSSLSPHRVLILASTCLLIAYSVAVLRLVWTVPEIGISTSFRLYLSRIDPDFVNQALRLKDEFHSWKVVALGGEPVQTWPDWLRLIEGLVESEFPPAEAAPESLRQERAGVRWVRVDLQNGMATDSVWCRVGRVSAATLLPSVLWMVLEAGLFVIGAIVFWGRPNDRGARLFYLQSLVVVGAYLGGFHWSRIGTQPILALTFVVCATLLPAVNLHFFLLFPSPRRIMYRRPGWTLAVVYGVPVVFAVTISVYYLMVRWLSRNEAPAEQINLALESLRDGALAYFAVAAVWYLASIGVLVHGYIRARDFTERSQAKWVIFGATLASVPFSYALFLAASNPGLFAGGAAIWPLFAASICISSAYAIGITRYRLLRLDQALSSGLAYFMVSGLAAMIYCALVLIAMLLFGSRGPSLEQAAWVGGSALLLSMSLDAARSRLRDYHDRRFRKNKTQLDEILQQLGGAVNQLIDTPTLAGRLLRISGDLQGCTRGAVYTRTATGGFELAGQIDGFNYPDHIDARSPLAELLRRRPTLDRLSLAPTDPARQQLASLRADVAAGLCHAEQLLAVIVLGRNGQRTGDSTDPKLLESFAPVAALALAGAEVRGSVDMLNRELQAKVDKISEQQRRIFALQQQVIAQSRRYPTVEADGAPTERAATRSPLESIIGSSPSLQKVLEIVPRVASNTSAVLIRGESGTGKELLAKALHDLSPRAAGPFVKVHCAALAPGLLESELFGHVKGAFTGAIRDKPGRFESADGGTLFLDEIGDISADVQTKLLRVLQEKTFERVGSNDSIRVDVRLVTATHQNLESLIRDGRFRADLYYRLNVITIELPSLRDRGEDVLELAHCFLRHHAARSAKPIDAIDDDAIVALRSYHWPGNIRELQNVIERAVVVCNGPTITLADLPNHVRGPSADRFPVAATHSRQNGRDAVQAARAARHAKERAEIVEALVAANWNRTAAASRLGMARSTLLSRMKKFGIADRMPG